MGASVEGASVVGVSVEGASVVGVSVEHSHSMRSVTYYTVRFS